MHNDKCTNCDSGYFVKFSSLRYKLCSICNTKVTWLLKEGQRSVLTDEVGEEEEIEI